MTALGWSCVLAATMVYAVGSVLQGWAAQQVTGTAVVRHPAYVAGLACDTVAWVASLGAARLLPLLVVQAVLSASVGVTVVLAWLVLHHRLRGRDVVAIGVQLVALTGLAVAFTGAGDAGAARSGTTALCLIWLAGSAVALGVGYARASSIPLAVVAGAAFSGAVVAVRAVPVDSVAAVVRDPLAYAVAAFAVVGSLAYARSLERGPVGPATAVLWSVEAVVAGAAGLALFGDQVRPGQGPYVVVEVLVVLGACAVLGSGDRSQSVTSSSPSA